MKDHSEKQLADTLTEEPVVFLGCTGSEITLVAGVSCGITFASGLVLFIALLQVSASLALLASVATFFGGGLALSVVLLRKLQVNKEQRGENYYREVIHLTLSDWGMASDKVFNKSATYARGRKL